MMIRVIGSAMIATSMSAAMRFEKLPGVRKNGDSALPSTISPTSATSRSVSQRASSRVHGRRPVPGATAGAHRVRRSGRARWRRRRMTASALTATRITTP